MHLARTAWSPPPVQRPSMDHGPWSTVNGPCDGERSSDPIASRAVHGTARLQTTKKTLLWPADGTHHAEQEAKGKKRGSGIMMYKKRGKKTRQRHHAVQEEGGKNAAAASC